VRGALLTLKGGNEDEQKIDPPEAEILPQKPLIDNRKK
jgi:hypothetical protein